MQKKIVANNVSTDAYNDRKKQELENCTFVKTILMLLIVFYHSIIFWTGNWMDIDPVYPSKFFNVLADWMNSFHVYAFALVSGYIFYNIKYEKEKYQDFIAFVSNKAKRLIVPYIFIASIWAVPIGSFLFKWDFFIVFRNFILGINPNQLWFLLMLFWVFLIFWRISDYSAHHTGKSFVLVIMLYGISIVLSDCVPNYFMIWTACQYSLFFWLGFKTRQYGLRYLEYIPLWCWVLIDILLYITCAYISKQQGFMIRIVTMGLIILLRSWGACMIFVVLEKLANHIRWKSSPLFTIVSSNSMTIYLVHQQIIYFIILALNGKVNPYINAMLNFGIAFLLSTVISNSLKHFKLTRFLIGEK